MKQTIKSNLITLSALACACANAQVVDGTVDGAYGASKCVQNVQTQFGDSNIGMTGFANGSELDAGYAVVVGTDLYIFAAGNVESNYNKLNVFIDCQPGGENRLLQNQSGFSYNALQRMGDDGSGNGLTFDQGFNADYFFNFSGGDNGGTYAGYTDYVIVGDVNSGVYLGSCLAQNGALSGGNDLGCQVTIDNSNVLGVTGGTEAACGKGVLTGWEAKIPLALLGNPTGPIKICIMQNGGGNDYFSNQILGGIGANSNLGEPRSVNLSNLAGSQYIIANTNAISGTITFQGLDSSVTKDCVVVEVRNGSESYTQTVELDANGGYTIAAPSNGVWEVSVKNTHWLRRTISGVDTSAGDANGVNLLLLNGDVLDENEVNLVGLGVIATAFGKTVGEEGYVAMADLDEDGEINLLDVALLATNFGQSGDE